MGGLGKNDEAKIIVEYSAITRDVHDMTKEKLDAIWADDKLGRRKEAHILQKFLIAEAERATKATVPQSYVLTIDAPYGQGKSWFLSKLKDQIALEHPVAFVDAWADDAGNEPLVALMAAVDDALQPFFSKPEFKAKAAGVAASMGTVLMKGVTGAFGKAAGKYLGEEFSDQASDELRKQIAEATAKGVEDAASAIQSVTDKFATKAIEQYRKRKNSINNFKSSLTEAIKAIGGEEFSPVFIFIDELDRCRPTYAISMLEEIKHIFDVPGLVFVIAMHGDQLTHSVNAVYGAGFDSADYLRRFFSRRYRLEDLGLGAIVIEQFARLNIAAEKFSPPMYDGAEGLKHYSADTVTTKILEFYGVGPREAIAVLRALKTWDILWEEPFPMDLAAVLVNIIAWVRGDLSFSLEKLDPGKTGFQFWFHGAVKSSPHNYAQVFRSTIDTPLIQAVHQAPRDNVLGHIFDLMREEARLRFPQGLRSETMKSKHTEYRKLTEMVGKFEDEPSVEAETPPSA